MSTIFLRIEHPDNISDRFLINCTAQQESIIKKANKKISSDDSSAMFVTLFGLVLPQDNSLSGRKNEITKAIQFIKGGLKKRKYPELASKETVLDKVESISSSFFAYPYGMFKVLKNPISLLDPSADYSVSNVIVNNDVDFTSLSMLNFV